jgi:hypothetical protein
MKLKKLKNYKFLFIINFTILVLSFNYNATACSDIKFTKKDIFIVSKKNNKKIRFNVEIADTDLKRKTGFQCKNKMKLNEGMLFIWKTEDYRSFWMKNTSIPLDIIFLNKIYEIIDIFYNTKPYSLNIISSKKKAKYVLELKKETLKKLDIIIGDKIDIQKN